MRPLDLFTAELIHKATLIELAAVNSSLPFLKKELNSKSPNITLMAMVGLLATVATECSFIAKEEMGGQAYFRKMYSDRADYVEDEKGLWKWRGRGIIQITGKANYEKYGKLLKLDLLNNPTIAKQPEPSARIAVAYFIDHGCDVWSNRGHWLEVRKLVNGRPKAKKRLPNGDVVIVETLPNGWTMFQEYVYNLLTYGYKAL